jgi:hypothetical protein
MPMVAPPLLKKQDLKGTVDTVVIAKTSAVYLKAPCH